MFETTLLKNIINKFRPRRIQNKDDDIQIANKMIEKSQNSNVLKDKVLNLLKLKVYSNTSFY